MATVLQVMDPLAAKTKTKSKDHDTSTTSDTVFSVSTQNIMVLDLHLQLRCCEFLYQNYSSIIFRDMAL